MASFGPLPHLNPYQFQLRRQGLSSHIASFVHVSRQGDVGFQFFLSATPSPWRERCRIPETDHVLAWSPFLFLLHFSSVLVPGCSPGPQERSDEVENITSETAKPAPSLINGFVYRAELNSSACRLRLMLDFSLVII